MWFRKKTAEAQLSAELRDHFESLVRESIAAGMEPGVMLRSLPVKDPGRLVQITRLMPNGKPGVVSYPLFQHFRDNLTSISSAAAELSSDAAIVVDGAEEVVSAEFVSGAHYSVLGD